ncbi:MAG: superoxide dismutase family protein [Patescibacteria group bacterium]
MPLFSFEGKEVKKARAEMSGDTITGTALFTEYLFGEQLVVKITLDLSGDPAKLIPGKHAVHIHAKASCEGGFTCAGGHFDPGPNGNTDPDMNHPYHAGDLPNIIIDENGKGKLEAVSTRVTLSEGPLCILSGEGTALMVHANPDPYTSGPHGSGVSGGPRIACGVISEIV